jgi:arsenite methyltransferase
MVAIYGNNKAYIFRAVRDMYSDVALHPDKSFHFPTGRLACLFVGYPAQQLDLLPSAAVESFAGVGYPFAARVIGDGDVVLDIGSGSGTDTLLASTLNGGAAVYGLDFTEAMLEKLHANAHAMGASQVQALEGNAEDIPLADGSVDVVTSNGVLNLVPDKARAFSEIARVLRPGGRLQIADIGLARPVSAASRADPKLWAECVVGAMVDEDYLAALGEAGLQVEVIGQQDYFCASVSADTRRAAQSLGAHAFTLRGVRRS